MKLIKKIAGPKLGKKIGFSNFLEITSLIFLDIAQDCSLGQFLTSYRAEISKLNK